jgi:hypothetical protein
MRPLAIAAVVGGLALAPAVVQADEAKSAIKPSMVLNLFSQPSELSVRATGREMMEPGPPPASHQGGEVQPDGSVKYGNVTVTVRNPCPPGTAHYEPPPLPGRKVK